MSYEILPHTADLRIHARAATLQELFRDMLRGMFAAMGPAAYGQRSPVRRIQLEAPDREALLVDFLNEALYLGDTNRETYDDVQWTKLTDTELDGEISGEQRASVRLQVKAATYHGLRIEEGGGGFTASVVFDI